MIRLKSVKQLLGIANRPLTLTEKILYSHVDTTLSKNDRPCDMVVVERGKSYLKIRPDRVAMQDASAQMALLQFMQSGKQQTAIPASIHCDHLITATGSGEDADLKDSEAKDMEVYQMLESCAKKYGIHFWRPGSGIIHQIVLENYAFPGGLMLGTDSHTPNAGGLGMLAIGVGGADAVDALAGIPWEVKCPKVLGVKLTGKLSGWTSPKDVILKLAGMLTVRGATGYVLEYFGPGVDTLSCTGMATICNMGAEVGATSSVFPFTESMKRYLEATGRQGIAETSLANAATMLRADPGAVYDRVIDIDLDSLEPHLNGPFTPDAAIPISKVKQLALENNWPTKISACLVGSCTNSSYEDLSLASAVIKQALDNGLKSKTEFLISPGSERVRACIERDGQADNFQQAGGKILSNSCGPCIGQWKRDGESRETNTILSSFNRNFRGRNDGNPNTMNFLGSPQLVSAMAFAGDITFNPITDSLPLEDGRVFKFQSPSELTKGDLPERGFAAGRPQFSAPLSSQPDSSLSVHIDPNSQRLQMLRPFDAWDGKEFTDHLLLLKVSGKCTTDHISAAGPWLKYKGHLENIAENTLIGAVNALNGKVNYALNPLNGQEGTIPATAKQLCAAKKPWIIVAEDNYGEGSAREHAALQPRFLGCSMIIAKSFARIHETNLKKQGIVPLTFANPSDYDRIPSDGCYVSTMGLRELLHNGHGELELLVQSLDRKTSFQIPVRHSMSADQLSWLRSGSALNAIRAVATS